MYSNFDRIPRGGMSNFQEIFLTNICDMDLLVRLRYIIIILDMQPMKAIFLTRDLAVSNTFYFDAKYSSLTDP
jgi:hypothetical protein